MRASSLSNDKVIDLLNHFFIPVFLSNEEFAKGGCAPLEERKELQRIFRETLDAQRSAGSVHVYLLGPDGKAHNSMHVASAYKVEKLVPMLEEAVAHYKLNAGRTLFPPGPQSRHPKCAPDSLVLHLVARNLTKQGTELVPTKTNLGETRSAGWGSYPSEDWIVLSKEDATRLLPKGAVQTGTIWQLDAEQASRFLTHFYPTTENNDVQKNKIRTQELTGTVIAVKGDIATAKLAGRLVMEHWFYHKADGNEVDARLAGYLEFEPATGRIRALRMTTEEATYNRRPFGVVLREVQ
jgi:hypothetical protein